MNNSIFLKHNIIFLFEKWGGISYYVKIFVRFAKKWIFFVINIHFISFRFFTKKLFGFQFFFVLFVLNIILFILLPPLPPFHCFNLHETEKNLSFLTLFIGADDGSYPKVQIFGDNSFIKQIFNFT